jgi:hypothetical protein
MSFLFYLGTHKPHWLWSPQYTGEGIPLFVSRRQLQRRRGLHPALSSWALDSGGFTQLSQFGAWDMTPRQYTAQVQRYNKEIGRLDFVAVMDWMCEPHILNKTCKTIKQHQMLTIQSYIDLMECDPHIPWLPVLQGWKPGDYFNHVEMYLKHNIDLCGLDRVGIGSVCRRQHTGGVEGMIRRLCRGGLSLHGFGFKTLGLAKIKRHLGSSDSMAWSFAARRDRPLAGCTHANCANCHLYAIKWRQHLIKRYTAAALQGELF